MTTKLIYLRCSKLLSEDYRILTADSEEDCIDKYFDEKKVRLKR